MLSWSFTDVHRAVKPLSRPTYMFPPNGEQSNIAFLLPDPTENKCPFL